MKVPIKPFVKPGEPLGFVADLKAKGIWPPRLRDRKDDNHDHPKATTPFLVIPVSVAPADTGSRPQSNSKAFHSKGIWIEDLPGTMVTTPVVGGLYRIKCRVRNLGAFPAYGGLADFFVNTPGAFTAAAGTGGTLPSIGHTGFSVAQGQEIVISCPNIWRPASAGELASSIVVHAYDPFADNLTSRFDARNDRHVGRHDLTPDVYVRDWTDSAAVHDDGVEPSTRNVFYRTSDVWNRRSAAPGGFVDDQPQNQNPRQGNGVAGDNFIFARISRSDASVEQTVMAHFLFAEFGTGSPYIDCSAAPDPSVTLLPGETSKIVSLPWHLHPSSSSHLCIAAQIYSDSDPYIPPGLLGYTPGWPTTDMIVINDNNKAQRNISVWDALPETEGMHFGTVFNAAMFIRDVTVKMEAPQDVHKRFQNSKVSVPFSEMMQSFRPGESLVLKDMLPGERRWIAFSYDKASFEGNEVLSVQFDEWVDDRVVNGFAIDIRPTTIAKMVLLVIEFQSDIFFRMFEGMGIEAAKDGYALTQGLLEKGTDVRTYLKALPLLGRIMTDSLNGMFMKYRGVSDAFGVIKSLDALNDINVRQAATALAAHGRALHQVDALQTMAVKSKGDLADILFTVRLQKEVYKVEKLTSSQRFGELMKTTEAFIRSYSVNRGMAYQYKPFVESLSQSFEETVKLLGQGTVRARYADLIESFTGTLEGVQKAHLNFLNAVMRVSTNR